MAKGSIGSYAFIVGVIIAIVLGLVDLEGTTTQGLLISLLIILGIIVGLLNITGKEVKDFLLAAVSLAIVSYIGSAEVLGKVAMIGGYLTGIFTALMALIIPAVIVVALKEIYEIGKSA